MIRKERDNMRNAYEFPIKVLLDEDKNVFIPFITTSAVLVNGTDETAAEQIARAASQRTTAADQVTGTASQRTTAADQGTATASQRTAAGSGCAVWGAAA